MHYTCLYIYTMLLYVCIRVLFVFEHARVCVTNNIGISDKVGEKDVVMCKYKT